MVEAQEDRVRILVDTRKLDNMRREVYNMRRTLIGLAAIAALLAGCEAQTGENDVDEGIEQPTGDGIVTPSEGES